MDQYRCMCSGSVCPRSAPAMHGMQTPGMGYVPNQQFGKTFELCKALQVGTIFPELYKPFCGKGGGVCR
ncbi:MAG: spore coat associated protein CotJA [Lachnospiraceae bacterium]|nr:spore coat associated protein CotJA [Lachnospiraceae bacterium]